MLLSLMISAPQGKMHEHGLGESPRVFTEAVAQKVHEDCVGSNYLVPVSLHSGLGKDFDLFFIFS